MANLWVNFAKSLPGNFLRSFSGKNLWLHLLAIGLTYLIVVSGLDRAYLAVISVQSITNFAWPAAVLGGLIPICWPLTTLILGLMRKDQRLILYGWALGQAALLGLLISTLYKVFTGRISPLHITDTLSSGFQFGWLRGGVFWGWPSSHTSVAFAMAMCFATLLPQNKYKWWIIAYSFYVGLGVSVAGIHWFSESIAGMLIGIAVGTAVGENWSRLKKNIY